MNQAFWINVLWFASTIPAAFRFKRSKNHIARRQYQVLKKLLADNAKTEYGKTFQFGQIQSVSDFQSFVPLCDYDEIAPMISRMANGERNILLCEPVSLFEPTSGSSSASKLIPYTANLKGQFQEGIGAWIFDLFRHHPTLLFGKAYWSISPIGDTQRRTSSGIPIGFEEDTAYLGRIGKMLNTIMAVPAEVKFLRSIENFRYATLLFLLKERNLRLISVWNPSFLTILLDGLALWHEALVTDIATGSISWPADGDEMAKRSLSIQMKANPQRAAEVARALTQPNHSRCSQLWPHLAILSCWADGDAEQLAENLATLFPHAKCQPKGLIATEAIVSIPKFSETGKDESMLSINSHFFEFISESGEVCLAHQLRRGQKYEVVVTTGGGLYRYQLYDKIESLGGLRIRFLGRSRNIADKVGEKVNEGHVRQIIDLLFKRRPDFCVLSPELDHQNVYQYTLFSSEFISAKKLEIALCENYHYQYARRLGQLGPAKVVVATQNGEAGYIAALQARGQRLGDIKPSLLFRHGGLRHYIFHETEVSSI